jgi:hypothetical protein
VSNLAIIDALVNIFFVPCENDPCFHGKTNSPEKIQEKSLKGD